MIPNVKKLGLICFDELYYLTYLDQLEKLKVIMHEPFCVVRNPTFPRTLKKFTLSGGRFPWKDMSIIGSLPNLEVLKLINYACGGDTWETTDGEFLQLKFLLIEKSDLRDWITECSHFPTLKCLILRICLCLSKIPDSIVEIPTLEVIEVDYRNKRLVKSAKEILEDQRDQGIGEPQVRIVGCLHESFSVDKTSGKKCYIIGAKELLIKLSDNPHYFRWRAHADSRFSVVAQLSEFWWLDIRVKIRTHILSLNTPYAAYLVFKLTKYCRGLESANAVVRLVNDEVVGNAEEVSTVVNLHQQAGGPQTPVRRDDGWMEVELGSFCTDGVDDDGEVEVRLTETCGIKNGLIVEGIEFRPKT